jgi:SAM-dependent methyltransferase
MKLINPEILNAWLPPHSIEWYEQVNRLQGKYLYPWQSLIPKPNGESIFDQEVMRRIQNLRVLDVGCGHGEFTEQCSSLAREIIGFDVTEGFVNIGRSKYKPNVSFIIGNAKKGLPFEEGEFDIAYIRKGPTSAYPNLKRVVKSGGIILGLHPGDEQGKELSELFPGLFPKMSGTSILDTIHNRLIQSNYQSAKVETVNSVEYLHSPLDIIKIRCFGQNHDIFEAVVDASLSDITMIFEHHASATGLPVTFSRYIVRAVV